MARSNRSASPCLRSNQHQQTIMPDVRYWHLADIIPTLGMSALWGKADVWDSPSVCSLMTQSGHCVHAPHQAFIGPRFQRGLSAKAESPRLWCISRRPRSVGPMEVFLPSSSFGSSSYRLLLSPLAVQILAIDRRTISFEIARIASAGRSTPGGP